MDVLIDALSSPTTMTSSQWLVLAIGLFIVLGSFYFMIKLFRIFKGIGKSSYTPNIGLAREHPYRGQSVSRAGVEEDAVEQSSNEVESTVAESEDVTKNE